MSKINKNFEFEDLQLNLEILAEECAEVIQAKSKIIRFGINNYHPDNEISNRTVLANELGDVLAMIDILIRNGLFTQDELDTAKQKKIEKLLTWYNVK